MNKKFLVGITTVLVSAFAAYGVSRSMNNSNTELSELTLANVEALAENEGGGGFGFGCGYAAYEWDNDWYEDTKTFIKCRRGCPEGSGTSPKYIQC